MSASFLTSRVLLPSSKTCFFGDRRFFTLAKSDINNENEYKCRRLEWLPHEWMALASNEKPAVEPIPQIIAFGGCGAADPWVDPRIFRYVLHATKVSRPRIALLTCASGDDQRVLARLHRLYRRMGAVTQQLKLGKGQEWHRPGLLSQHFDLIHVEGGNTGFLMHQLQQNSMRSALHEAWLNGVVLTGTSAGASCWFAHA